MSTPTFNIPVYPQPGFYETTVTTVPDEDLGEVVVGPGAVEQIVARPSWAPPAYDVDKAWNRVEVQFIAKNTKPRKGKRR